MKQILSMNYAVIGNDWILDHPSTIFTNDDIPVETFATEEECNYHISQKEPSDFPLLPDIGEWCEMNKVYAYGEKMVKCLQPHNRMHFTPEETPALFLIIEPTGTGYPVWVQPTGAHDSYRVGDIVWYPTKDSQLWECTAGDASGYNSWAPGVYGWTKI